MEKGQNAPSARLFLWLFSLSSCLFSAAGSPSHIASFFIKRPQILAEIGNLNIAVGDATVPVGSCGEGTRSKPFGVPIAEGHVTALTMPRVEHIGICDRRSIGAAKAASLTIAEVASSPCIKPTGERIRPIVGRRVDEIARIESACCPARKDDIRFGVGY